MIKKHIADNEPRDSLERPVLAISMTLLSNIIFSPFYFLQFLRMVDPNPKGVMMFSDGLSSCCEATSGTSIEATAFIFICLMLASFFGFLAGGVKSKVLLNLLILFSISVCFFMFVVGMPALASTDRLGG
jgi:hypothetical protein